MAGTPPSPSVPTMREVASLAEVSTMTVSRVLRGHPGVSAVKRERVEAAVKELGYRTNTLARSLRHGARTGTVGVIVTHLGNPFYARLALGIEEMLATQNLRVMITNTDGDVARERDALQDFTERRVDGLILVPAGSHQAYVADEVGTSTPLVVVARPPVGLDADCVLVDDFGGAHAATARLIAEGHRRIGFLGTPPSVYTGSERYRGFCAALEEAGIVPDEDYVRRGQEDLAAAERAATELLALRQPPTAMFCTNNRNTLGAYRAVRRAGARTTLAGFDNFELADVLSVPVVVVAYDADELGRQAARLLADRMPSPERPDGTAIPPRRIVVPTTLLSYAPDDDGTPAA